MSTRATGFLPLLLQYKHCVWSIRDVSITFTSGMRILSLNLYPVSSSRREQVILMENGESGLTLGHEIQLTQHDRQWWLPVVAMYIFPCAYKNGHVGTIINILCSHPRHSMVFLPRVAILASPVRKISPGKEGIKKSLRLQR